MSSVILYPIVTEKSAGMQANNNQYVFAVERNANKLEIANAVKSLKKGLEIESISTQIVRGKVKRMGMFSGKRANWKKAIVRLKAGQTLELVEAV